MNMWKGVETVERRKTKRRSVRFYVTIAVLLAVITAAIYFTTFFLVVRNSYEFKADKVDYLFYDESSGKYYLVRFVSSSKLGYIIEFPPQAFYAPTMRAFDPDNLEATLIVIEDMLSLSKDASFYASVGEKAKKLLGELGGFRNGFVETLNALSGRGVKFFDYLKAQKYAETFKPRTNLTGPAFLKLLDRLNASGMQKFEIKGLTKRPIVIEVDTKKYERIYLDESSVKQVKNILR